MDLAGVIPPGDGDRPKPGQDMGPQVNLAQQDPWLGGAGLWGDGDWPCCSIARKGLMAYGADMGSWDMGR